MATAADEEDDFEVIQANSPLYWSMVDAGLEDIGGQDVHNIDKNATSDTDLKSKAFDKESWIPTISKLFSHQLLPLFMPNHPDKGLPRDVSEKMFMALANSSLLTEEDAIFLHDLTSEGHWSKSKGQDVTTSSKKALLGLTAVWVFLLLLAFLPVSGTWVLVMSNTGLVMLLPVWVWQTLSAVQTQQTRRKAVIFEEKVQQVLAAATKCMEVTTKSVRFIQESELVARGFTFVGSTGSSRVVKDLQKTSGQRQCPALREKLFLTDRALFFSFRRSFASLLDICPVRVEVAGVMRYCSEIPLSQYPEMLQENNALDAGVMENLSDVTDGFSVDVLKSMQELNRIHLSEFIRRLAVGFVETSKESDTSSSVASLLDSLAQELNDLQVDLQSLLTAHRHGTSGTSMQHRRACGWRPPSSASEITQMYTAVHSLELHLLAALKNIQDLAHHMEEKMEATSGSCSLDGRLQSDSEAGNCIENCEREAWQQLLSLARSELTACSGCLDEGMRYLVTKQTQIPSLSATQSPKANDQMVNVVKLSAQDNPIILDEVFEAYSEPQEYEGLQNHSDLTSAEEEEWKKRQKTNLKLCLHELQAIIDVKAAERLERERVAMNRMTSSASQDGSAGQASGLNTLHTPVSLDAAATNVSEDGENGHSVCVSSTEDLARDIEERVEFWKQFDEMCRPTAGPVISAMRVGGDEDCGDRFSEISGEGQDTDMTSNVCQLSTSSSQESDFIFVSTSQDSVIDRIKHISDAERSGIVSEEEEFQRLADVEQQSAPSLLSTLSGAAPTDSTKGDTSLQQNIASNEKGFDAKKDRVPVEISDESFMSVSPINFSSSEVKPEEEEERRLEERSEAEGTAEHLSLPGAPSPFAFSIASMVASRARQLVQTEDTFGDGSSSEEEEERDQED